MQDVFAHIDAQRDDTRARLEAMLRQPSVAAQNLGISEMADLTAAALARLGAPVEVLPTGGAPVVVGRFSGRSARTLLVYNHYDVQPPDPLELWNSDPWTPTERAGCLYARGVADNKGNLAARLAAVEALLAVRGELPCGVTFAVEGEEEIGSPHLAAFAAEHAAWLRAADGCLWEFGGKDLQERPVVTLGLKGIAYFELRATTAARDLHSSWAAVAPNAAWRLVWALASLKGPDERVRLPGFYDSVVPPNAADLDALRAMGFDEAGYKATFGLEDYVLNLSGEALLTKLYFEPTCTVCGFDSGYGGPGTKTVSPHAARAKLDFRLVPDQDPDQVADALRAHLDAHGFADVAVEMLAGERAGRTPLDDSLGRLAVETAREVYDRPPVVHPISPGSGPLHTLCGQFGVPAVAVGCSYPGAQVHAPNEHIRLKDFWEHAKHTALLLDRFAAA